MVDYRIVGGMSEEKQDDRLHFMQILVPSCYMWFVLVAGHRGRLPLTPHCHFLTTSNIFFLYFSYWTSFASKLLKYHFKGIKLYFYNLVTKDSHPAFTSRLCPLPCAKLNKKHKRNNENNINLKCQS